MLLSHTSYNTHTAITKNIMLLVDRQIFKCNTPYVSCTITQFRSTSSTLCWSTVSLFCLILCCVFICISLPLLCLLLFIWLMNNLTMNFCSIHIFTLWTANTVYVLYHKSILLFSCSAMSAQWYMKTAVQRIHRLNCATVWNF